MSHLPPRNLLFDLGGVLYEIDFATTFAAFVALPQSTDSPLVTPTALKNSPEFQALDSGKHTIDSWAASLKAAFGWEAETDAVKKIWRELLIGLYPGRVELLSQLATQYTLGLLSNTSHFHYQHYISECRPMFDKMQHLFFSFEIGMTKPGEEIYRHVLYHSGWKAEETLFLDDSASNIQTAERLGFQTALISSPEQVEEIARQLLAR